MKVTAFELKLAVLEYYRFGKQCVSVDEFKGADVIADTGKEIIEIEVKVDRQDLRKGEFRKRAKHICYGIGKPYHQCHPNKYLFCVPTELVETAQEVVAQLNPMYGILAFDTAGFNRIIDGGYVPYTMRLLTMVKRARKLHDGYAPGQQRNIAKRASSKLITLMQQQHADNVKRSRSSVTKTSRR